MRKYLIAMLIPLMLIFASGCATFNKGPDLTPLQNSQQAAEQTVYAIGVSLQAIPGICDAFYAAGKMDKETYNKVVPIYNQALGSYKLLLMALRESLVAGNDPNAQTAYVTALNRFLLDKQMLDSLALALGVQPAGGGK